MRFIVFIPRPVTTSFDGFFVVQVHGSCILKLSGTGLVSSPSKKGNRTETGPDFKALDARCVVWAIGESFFFIVHVFLLLNDLYKFYGCYKSTEGFMEDIGEMLALGLRSRIRIDCEVLKSTI